MKKPEHTKPFNLEHAKAGAPYTRADGTEHEIVKWDRNHTQQLVAVSKQDAAIRTFRTDGSPPAGGPEMHLVMTPLGYIDGKPVFVGDEVEFITRGGEWVKKVAQSHERMFPDHRWPAPAKVYPETQMSAMELARADGSRKTAHIEVTDSFEREARAIANAALRHAIDAGQVVLPGGELKDCDILHAFDEAQSKYALVLSDRARAVFVSTDKSLLVTEPEIDQMRADLADVQRKLNDRAARDMAIAEAVRKAAVNTFSNTPQGNRGIAIQNMNLAAIIAKVQA